MNERDLKNLINQIKNNTQEALKSSQMGLWEEAERINRMMIQEIECDYRAYGRLADALMKLGKSAEAADYYDIVSDLDRSKKDITKKLSSWLLNRNGQRQYWLTRKLLKISRGI